ncbi:hypothetical protein F4561_002713 [Lipingzhangella halophila]|uniref:Uncharacterized protein n=1 Tax=Lipingzhangella halophila TaxID=1783352 RepID=A0A7W7RH51_9ACTN|nr:hypothetical protein [Lipingzhangella halophila]MBB4931893.1 hypothetical protein [Lipingzhangella halophila]
MLTVYVSALADTIPVEAVTGSISPLEWAWLAVFGAAPILLAVLAWLVSSRGPVEMTARQQGEAEQARTGGAR